LHDPLFQGQVKLKDTRVVLPHDVFIPGFRVLEIGAVIQGKIDGHTIMVELKEL